MKGGRGAEVVLLLLAARVLFDLRQFDGAFPLRRAKSLDTG